MTTTKQIIAIAELDGWLAKPDEGAFSVFKDGEYRGTMSFDHFFKSLPQYDHSRDALAPVLKKVLWGSTLIYRDFEEALRKGWGVVNATQALTVLEPENIAEALLRATGKWVED